MDANILSYLALKAESIQYGSIAIFFIAAGVGTVSIGRIARLFPTITTTNTEKISSFDPRLSGVRGLASFGVFVFHFTQQFFLPTDTVSLILTNVSIAGFALGFVSTLYMGVPLFVMLSIFLLIPKLDATKGKPDRLKNYFRRRIIRIWPTYYGVVIACWIIFRIPTTNFVSYLGFASVYLNSFPKWGEYPPLGAFWTLQIEELAYALFPLISMLGAKMRTRLGLSLILFGFLWFLYPRTGSTWVAGWQGTVPGLAPAYGFGLLALNGKSSKEKLRWLSPIGIGGLAILPYAVPFASFDYIGQVACYFTCLVGFSAILSKPPNVLKYFAALGEISYALYAIHIPFLTGFIELGNEVLAFPCAIATAFLIEFLQRGKEIIYRLRMAYSKEPDSRILVT